MSAQNHIEKTLRKMHILLSESEAYNKEKNLVIIDKKEMLTFLRDLSQGIYDMMDEHELTRQKRDQAERNVKKRGDELIADAGRKAEDVYAASILYTDEALKRVQLIMQDTMQSVKDAYDKMNQEILKEIQNVKADQTDLTGYLHDLADSGKYLQIIEERNRRLAKEKAQDKEEAPMPAYAAVKPEIRINEDYFREHGLSLEEEEEVPEEKTEKVTAEVSVNLDSEYFKWKEREARGESGEDSKKNEKKPKSLFGKLGK